MVRATAEYRLSLYARTLGLREIDAARDGFIRHYAKWPQLILEAQQLIDSGAEPGDPESRELCSRWITLFQAVWGTDPEVREKVLAAHANVPEILEGSGITMRIAAFLAQGIAQLQAGSQARPASNENKNG